MKRCLNVKQNNHDNSAKLEVCRTIIIIIIIIIIITVSAFKQN